MRDSETAEWRQLPQYLMHYHSIGAKIVDQLTTLSRLKRAIFMQ